MTDDAAFARLHLRGARPSDNAKQFPVVHLIEAQRYRALILKAAQDAWARANPKLDIPTDLSIGFDLDVTGVEDGSAVLVFAIAASSIYLPYFEAGREKVNEVIVGITETVADGILSKTPLEETSMGAPSPSDLPAFVYTTEFKYFGSSLGPEQSLAIEALDAPPALVTEDLRRSKLEPFVESLKVSRVTRHGDTLAGRLIQLDADNQTFRIATLQHGVVAGRYKNTSLTDDLKLVLQSRAVAPVLRIKGDLRYLQDDLKLILDISEVSLFDVGEQPWSQRLIEIASLRKNWDGDGAPVIEISALEVAKNVLEAIGGRGSRLQPALFPDESGGVRVEWTDVATFWSATIAPDLTIETYRYSKEGGAESLLLQTHIEAIEILSQGGLL